MAHRGKRINVDLLKDAVSPHGVLWQHVSMNNMDMHHMVIPWQELEPKWNEIMLEISAVFESN